MTALKMKLWKWLAACALLCVSAPYAARAQEVLAPLLHRTNPASANKAAGAPLRKGTTALSLPFIDDFTDYSPYPNAARWVDSEVYINGTMGVHPITRGVATFDALNKYGRPYDTTSPYFVRFADSLTSQPVDLSANTAGDSIYFSFFYQPQGNGFSPDNGDSLILYFHRSSGGYQKVWAVNGGTGVQDFRQVMIPVTDTQFFAPDFQFRFVNIVSISTNDDVWNVDYVQLKKRNYSPGIPAKYDTLIQDLTYIQDPSFLLNDYTFMPYRQFLANPAGERAATMGDTIANREPTAASITYGYSARELSSGIALGSGSVTNSPFAINEIRGVSFPTYTTMPALTGKVVFENKFYLRSGTPNQEPTGNDTAIREQVFDNYLAYDDGTAEKSYFLNLFPTLPGKIALDFHLNVPDTLRGLAIYFGQQVPTASNKLFSIAVYRSLQGVLNSSGDNIIYSEDNFLPLYTDSVNGFTMYRLGQPLLLPAGTFFMGITQPANSGSDSLYIGYDANRVGGNHLYFNVGGVGTNWQSSLFSGALMMRPLLGGAVRGTGVQEEILRPPAGLFFPIPRSARCILLYRSIYPAGSPIPLPICLAEKWAAAQ